MSVSDTNTTAYKTMTTSMVSLSGYKFRIKNSVYWDVLPKTRDFDIIGAALGGGFAGNSGTQYAQQVWTEHDYSNGKLVRSITAMLLTVVKVHIGIKGQKVTLQK